MGWIRASEAPVDHTEQIIKLQNQVETLQAQLLEAGRAATSVANTLARGEDEIPISFSFDVLESQEGKGGRKYWRNVAQEISTVGISCNRIFSILSPSLVTATSGRELLDHLKSLVHTDAMPDLKKQFAERRIENIRVFIDEYDRVCIQLMALGLIEKKSPDEWILTRHGRNEMVPFLAVHRTNGDG